jgi:hypothetical protein
MLLRIEEEVGEKERVVTLGIQVGLPGYRLTSGRISYYIMYCYYFYFLFSICK